MSKKKGDGFLGAAAILASAAGSVLTYLVTANQKKAEAEEKADLERRLSFLENHDCDEEGEDEEEVLDDLIRSRK